MQRPIRFGAVAAALLALTMAAGIPAAVSQPANGKATKATTLPQAASGQSDSETQAQLLKLLRLSPTLTMVVARDPSLLSDQDYVERNSPELAQFLVSHPEVARNPSFYLFSDLPKVRGERSDQALERKIWPDMEPVPSPSEHRVSDIVLSDLGGFVAFICVVGALLWLIRMLMENRRWNRIFKLQTEVHTKLIERFGNNQELLTYMSTDAGKRFLEAAPIPVDFDRDQHRFPGGVAKVLMPMQIGVVLTLLGFGLLALVHRVSYDLATTMLVFGMVVLMPGLGFILSAGITWFLASRLGLMPGPGNDTQANGREQ